MIALWPRLLELLVAFWLLAAPSVLGHGGGSMLGRVDRGAGALIALVVLLSLVRRLERLHFATLPIALALAAWSWASFERPGPPGAQSQILAGLTLALLALVPTASTRPPEEWRPWVDEEGGGPDPGQTANG